MNVAYSQRAIADLADIGGYLLERSPHGAFAVELRLREVIDRLAEFPGMGRTLQQRPDVRVVTLGRYPYLIFYTTLGDELSILHIRHGARRPVEPEGL